MQARVRAAEGGGGAQPARRRPRLVIPYREV